MQKVSSFGGYAGEVISDFISPATLVAIVPIVLVSVVAGVLAGMLGQGSAAAAVIGALFMFFVSSVIIGRFAIAGARGEFKSGLLVNDSEWGEAVQFAVRHTALLLAIEAPLFGLMLLLNLGAFMFSLPIGAAGFGALGALILLLLMLAAPLITTVAAAGSTSVGAAFSGAVWRWILVERFRDLITFLAGVMGGSLVFFIVYMIPLSAIAALAGVGRSAFGVVSFMSLIPALPALAAPILVGRLAGAFVLAHGEPADSAGGSGAAARRNAAGDQKREAPLSAMENSSGFDC